MLTDDTRIQVIIPDQPIRWVTIVKLAEYIEDRKPPELTPAQKAAQTKARNKATTK